MVSEDGAEVERCDLICRDLVRRGFDDDHLGQAVHENADGRVSELCLWKVGDEIDGDTLPGSQWGVEGLEQADGKALARFDSLAGGAGSDVLIDESSHPWPVKGA